MSCPPPAGFKRAGHVRQTISRVERRLLAGGPYPGQRSGVVRQPECTGNGPRQPCGLVVAPLSEPGTVERNVRHSIDLHVSHSARHDSPHHPGDSVSSVELEKVNRLARHPLELRHGRESSRGTRAARAANAHRSNRLCSALHAGLINNPRHFGPAARADPAAYAPASGAGGRKHEIEITFEAWWRRIFRRAADYAHVRGPSLGSSPAAGRRPRPGCDRSRQACA